MCPAIFSGGCYIYCLLGTRHVTGMDSGTNWMLLSAGAAFPAWQLMLPCHNHGRQGGLSWEQLSDVGGWPCVRESGLGSPLPPESFSAGSLAASEVLGGVWGAAARCVSVLLGACF